MKNFRLLAITLSLLTFFSACKKDDAPIKTKTKSEMISSTSGKQWKLVASTVTYIQDGETETDNMLEDYEACELDDLYIMFADKKYEEREGASKCDPTDSDLMNSGAWELRNNDTELVFTVNGNELVYKVLDISESSIKVEDSLTLADGDKLIFTETYKAQ